MKTNTEIVRSRAYPEEKILNLKRGERLIWFHPDYTSMYGPFMYVGQKTKSGTFGLSAPDLPPHILIHG
jgi:hypothetical protein